MENSKKYTKKIHWTKYLIFGIVFGAIFELLGSNLTSGAAALIAILVLESIY
ncbi:hypothetical protein [Clostridium polynesiense]|uniref:hypothetical protein n=1 Tax=Clostridium polynesiense TaxID=1325933 RepID=UPI000ACF3639|nr:hypothetical protein [Clostridium polynesiense]